MNTGNALLLLSLAVTACAGTSARPAVLAHDPQVLVQSTAPAEARLGPPSPRGLGLRRVDRPIATEAPLARY
ncbi:MAG TPA: hypothetical protein VER96_01430 [Polyangiaceae bacterium]|nr:hypothetical protein [Polyangiaceae bacterium]